MQLGRKGCPTYTPSQNKKQPLTLARSVLLSSPPPPPSLSSAFLFLYFVILFSSVLFFVCRLLDCYSWQIKLETCKISLVIGKDTCVFLKSERGMGGEREGERVTVLQATLALPLGTLYSFPYFPRVCKSVVLSQFSKLITKLKCASFYLCYLSFSLFLIVSLCLG